MLKVSDQPQVFLRYGLSRKKELLRDFTKLYDGIVVPANILLYQYKGTPAVVYSCNQPYFVDPMSYLFAHPLADFIKRITKGTSKFKPSFTKLVMGYGEDPAYFLRQDYRTLVEYLTKNESKLSPFIDNCIDFQLNAVNKTINNSKDLLPDGKEVDLKPSFVMPPYFAYQEHDGTTLLNQKIIEYCWKNKAKWGNPDIFPMIFIQKENLTDKFITKLKSFFKDYDYPGYCIWVEKFEERDVTSEEIVGLIKLVETFSDNSSKQLVMLYGGFFSMLLNKFGVTAISHGIAYSEAKSMFSAVKQTGGGAPIRYYIPQLHQFQIIDNALHILRERPDLICNCPVCQRLIQSDPENITRFHEEEELAELHFLYNRNEEKKMISKLNKADIGKYLNYIATLNTDIEKITRKYKVNSKFETRSIISANYINEWKNAIDQVLV